MHAIKPLHRALALAFGTGVSSFALLAPAAHAHTADGKVERIEITGSSIKRIDSE